MAIAVAIDDILGTSTRNSLEDRLSRIVEAVKEEGKRVYNALLFTDYNKYDNGGHTQKVTKSPVKTTIPNIGSELYSNIQKLTQTTVESLTKGYSGAVNAINDATNTAKEKVYMTLKSMVNAAKRHALYFLKQIPLAGIAYRSSNVRRGGSYNGDNE